MNNQREARRSNSRRLAGAIVAAATLLLATPAVQACPFCGAAMQTLSQEIAGADAAAIAELIKPAPALPADPQASIASSQANATATFRIVEPLSGKDKLAGVQEIDVVYFGQDPPDKKFLVSGLFAVSPDKLDWTMPVPLSPAAVEYVRQLPKAPATGADRLAFFQDYLEHEDPLLRQDSYDEFARAPYEDVIALGPRMAREKLLQWIGNPGVGPSGRRLYLTMLGVCGQPEDVAMLEELLRYDFQLMKPGIATCVATCAQTGSSLGLGLVDEVLHAEERRKKESLDALVACYLKLKGADGLELINQKFFANRKVEYIRLHSAIMALRFHGEETDVLPRKKLLESMRMALDHAAFADQIIPDLTRWEDWDSMPRLVKMFREASSDDYIRQPVVSYLLVMAEQPGEVGERGQAALKELEALDPDTVERARSMAAFSFLARASSTPAATTNASAAPDQAVSGSDPSTAVTPTPTANPTNVAPSSAPSEASANAGPAATPAASASDLNKDPQAVAQAAPATATKPGTPAPLAAVPLRAPSTVKLVGVPLVAATVLLAIFAVLLRGTDPRSSEENQSPPAP